MGSITPMRQASELTTLQGGGNVETNIVIEI
jgi:hypothetical protein